LPDWDATSANRPLWLPNSIIDQAGGYSFCKERALRFQKEPHVPPMLLAVALDFIMD
jgi:hypothetical protein